MFKSRLLKEISAIESQQKATVYLIDIDGFQSLNAIEGNGVGDQVLRAISRRLAHYMGGEDRLARLGNDEFALFKTSDSALEDGCSTAQEIHTLLNQIKTYGCYEIQGYYFSPPLPAAELFQLLQQSNSWGEKLSVGIAPDHLLCA